jgi:hypothetical protein
MGLDAMLGAAERPQIMYPGLSRRPTLSGWEIRLGVVQVHPSSASCIRKAAGRHPQEHRLLDAAWNLVSIDRGDIDWVDHRLHSHLATGLAKEAANLLESDGSDPLHPSYATAQPAGTEPPSAISNTGQQRLLAEMNVQHHLRP